MQADELAQRVKVVLVRPTPHDLYVLGAGMREALLDASAEEQACLTLSLRITEEYFDFLSQVQAKMSAESYNKFAALLDLGAFGSVALGNLLFERDQHVMQKLLAGGLSESLMLVGSLQYVKAWEQEAQALFMQSAWQLHATYWQLALLGQSALPPAERRRTLEELFAPCFDVSMTLTEKTVYVGRLFQWALVSALGSFLTP